MLVEFLPAILISLALSLVLNRIMLAVAPRLGLMDQPGERRIHSAAIPRAGGLAIWVTFLIVMALLLVFRGGDASRYLSWTWFGAFAGASLILIVAGILDDRQGLRPLVKLGAHILAPTVFFLLQPVQTGLFPDGWPAACEYAVFVIWTVALINAFNLIDGLDGLCGGLGAVASAALAALALANGHADSALLLAVMGAAILGFLKYNFNPARIFLGDAGSMLIGFFLATAATEAVGRKAVVGIILLPIAVAGVPLLDVLLAIWRRGARQWARKLQGTDTSGGIFDADSDHLHHRLLRSRGSQKKVAVILQGIAIILALLAFLPSMFGDRVVGFSLVGFLVVGLSALKNLARVEIQHTGDVLHMAIKLPGHRRRMAAALFLYDLLVLAGAATAAALIETNLLVRGAPPADLARFVVLFTVLGSIALLIVRVHHRLWVRATMRDVLSLQFWLLLAALASFSLFSLIYASLEWSGLRIAVMSYVFACVGVCLPRVILDLLREFGLDARHFSEKAKIGKEIQPMVVLGAGDLGTLFLDHLKSSTADLYPGMRLLGFLDESRVIHGRRLRSFPIIGGLSIIPDLVRNAGLKAVIVAIENPREELLRELDRLRDEFDLTIFRWKVGIEEL